MPADDELEEAAEVNEGVVEMEGEEAEALLGV